jgi:hypothetical protein
LDIGRSWGDFRNRWVLETRDFLDQRNAAAEVVRDTAVRPQEAVRRHPELAGTYLNLRAAQIAGGSFATQRISSVSSTRCDPFWRAISSAVSPYSRFTCVSVPAPGGRLSGGGRTSHADCRGLTSSMEATEVLDGTRRGRMPRVAAGGCIGCRAA